MYSFNYDAAAHLIRFITLGASGDAFALAAPFPQTPGSHHISAVMSNHELSLFVDKTLAASGSCPLIPGFSLGGTGRASVGFNSASAQPSAFRGVLDRVRISSSAFAPTEFFGTQKPQAGLIILKYPVGLSAVVGDAVGFEIAASASVPITYEWRFNDQLISGATSNVLNLPNLHLEQAGNYTVTLRAGVEQAIATAKLSVREPDTTQVPIITGQPESQLIALGSLIQFTVAARSPTPLAYQWSYNGAPLSAANSASLIVPAVTISDAGTYSVKIQNVAGTVASQGAILDIYVPARVGEKST